jgi:excisionase family DNA binding protein
MNEPMLLNIRAACRETGGIGRDRMYELVKTGKIRSVRIGRKILIPRTALVEFVERESGAEPRR